MPIEQDLYALLSGNETLTTAVEGRIYPSTPADNTKAPFVVYTFTSAEPQNTLDGPTDLTKYELEVEIWGLNSASVLNIGAIVRNVLHYYRGGVFQGIFLKNDTLPKEDEGYSKTQTYTVWGRTVNILHLPNSTSTITTGQDTITMNACGRSLVLNCDGLTLDGGAVGDGGSLPTDPQFDSVSLYDEVNGTYSTVSVSDNTFTFSGQSSQSDIQCERLSASGVGTVEVQTRVLKVQPAPGVTTALTEWKDATGAVKAQVTASGAYLGPSAPATVGGQTMQMSIAGYANLGGVRFNGSDTGENHVYQQTGNLGLAVPDDPTCSVVFRTAGRRLATVGSVASLNDPIFTLWSHAGSATSREIVSLEGVFSGGLDARKGQAKISAWDTAKRECIRVETNGSAPMVGFFGGSATTKPTVSGSRSSGAALTSLLSALSSLGLITDATTA